MLTQNLKNSPDNVYFNISMVHSSSDGSNPSSSSYIANKTQPIINNPQDYYMTIIQFSIPLNQCPILICPVLTTLGNTNITPMKIGIRDFTANIIYEQPLIWVPELTYETPIVQTGSASQNISPYYYMYEYETLINMFNTALNLAFIAYNAANPGNPHIAFPCPLFVYDANTQLISLIAHSSWTTTSPLNQVICVNNDSFNFLDAFPTTMHSKINDTYNYDNCFTIFYNGLNGFPTNNYPTAPTYIKMIQNYDQMHMWNSLRKLIITSGSLPINNEQSPILNDANPDQYNTIPIVADFLPNASVAGDTRETAFYSADQFRLIDLSSNMPLNKIQFEIFWADKQNNLLPLKISKFQEVTMKLCFVKKSLYNNEY